MTYLTPMLDFRKLDPFAVGFDEIFKDLQEMTQNTAKQFTAYPPYNKIGRAHV